MKTILVTGGSRGLGLALCRELLARDYRVITASRRSSPELDALRNAHGDRLAHHRVDFSQPDQVRQFIVSANLLDGVDGFVANAAVGTEGLLTLTSEESIRQCLEVNLIATMLVARAVIKGMLSRGGSLVFVSSVAARTGLTGLSVYAATKGALVSFARALAREYGERGIRSNCVLPGFIETEMSAALAADQKDRLTRRTALRRLGAPEDVVGAVLFLLSDDARYITGTELVVDGGMTA